MKFLTFDETRDFPYYKHNPRISKGQWFILLLLIPIGLLGSVLIQPEIVGSMFFCFILLIPLLYFSNWDYKLMFHKPTKNEIILGVLMFAGYMIYAILMGFVLDTFHLSAPEITEDMGITLMSIVSLIFSMMGEELLKFIPLMLLLRIFYKYSNNRKLSIALSTAIVMMGFGFLHYAPGYTTLISALALQGFGTIFEMYGYLKTKNIFVPYISHILTDAVAFILIMQGVG